ncbi:MAG: hypothetical protein IH971_09545 [Candidatus Marinimicrobia bacterium]|nr:hypothetical protein [Candidatus Neomarinimicrobiota bacterium]
MNSDRWALILLCAVAVGRPAYSQDTGERGALVRSLILPGWGQQVLGRGAAARRLILAEASLWLSYALTSGAANWYQQDYRALAALRAGVSQLPESDIYYFRLGEYISATAYNQAQLRQRKLDALYPLGSGIDWQWDDSTSFKRYYDLRQSSLLAAKRASFTLGGLVLNRAIAAVHVLIISRLSGRPPEAAWRPLPGGGLLTVRLPL